MAMTEGQDRGLFIARQPICDRDGAIAGYELLYRSGLDNEARVGDADYATARVLTTTFLEVGLERLVGSTPAYVNLTRPFFTGEIGLPVTPDRIVLEVLEDFALDAEVMAGLRRLVDDGYSVVLDDFCYRPDYESALSLVRGIKLDRMALDETTFRAQLALARRKGLTVVVERVETAEQFRLCRELGCDLFQGFFFSRPHIVAGKLMPGNQAVLLTLLARLEDPAAEIEELERLIVQDVTLTYRLLRQVNSAAFALRREVESVRQAIILLGSRLIRHWASLILLSQLPGTTANAEPLMSIALLRGRMCEALAVDEGDCEASQAFTVGLFSVLDALLEQPMDTLLEDVTFSPPVHDALLAREGALGALLGRVIDYEEGRWHRLDDDAAGRYRRAYIDAANWSDRTRELL